MHHSTQSRKVGKLGDEGGGCFFFVLEVQFSWPSPSTFPLPPFPKSSPLRRRCILHQVLLGLDFLHGRGGVAAVVWGGGSPGTPQQLPGGGVRLDGVATFVCARATRVLPRHRPGAHHRPEAATQSQGRRRPQIHHRGPVPSLTAPRPENGFHMRRERLPSTTPPPPNQSTCVPSGLGGGWWRGVA